MKILSFDERIYKISEEIRLFDRKKERKKEKKKERI